MAEPTTKGLFSSKTFWGVVVLLLATQGKQWFDLDLDQMARSDIATQLAAIGGAVLAIWGRLKATKAIDDLY